MNLNLITTILSTVLAFNVAVANPAQNLPKPTTLASRSFSLENRYHAKSVNEVMKKNILLSLAYLNGSIEAKGDIVWDQVMANQTIIFTLKPNEAFAFHNDLLPEYEGKVVKTTNSIFGASQGYLYDGYLYGDGVCHIASLLNWAAQDAGLEVLVTKDHRSVGPINEIPDDYGVSIYIDPSRGIGERNNLYITNNQEVDITFSFEIQDGNLTISVLKAA